MFSQARESGVQHIVTCEKGGQIYGDELVYTLTGIIKDLDTNKGRETDPMEESIVGGEARKILNSLFANAGNLGKAIVQSAETVSVRNRVRRGKKPKIDRAEGISIDNSGGVQSVSSIDSTVIAPGGILSVVTPWRPGLAGRLAAQAVKMLAGVNAGEVSYIGACKNSTGALWLDVSEEELMMSDWRVPGSCSPILQGNVKIYAVDPIKDLQPVSEEELWMVVDSARKASTYTVVDLAGNMALAHRAARQGRMVLLVVVPGNDPVELRVTSIWTKNLADGNSNIVTGIDIRGVVPDIPAELNPRVIVRNNPADALSMALRMHKGNMFVWV